MVFDPSDPRIFVPKRLGLGWTLNFAHPVSYVVLIGILVAAIGLAYLRRRAQGK